MRQIFIYTCRRIFAHAPHIHCSRMWSIQMAIPNTGHLCGSHGLSAQSCERRSQVGQRGLQLDVGPGGPTDFYSFINTNWISTKICFPIPAWRMELAPLRFLCRAGLDGIWQTFEIFWCFLFSFWSLLSIYWAKPLRPFISCPQPAMFSRSLLSIKRAIFKDVVERRQIVYYYYLYKTTTTQCWKKLDYRYSKNVPFKKSISYL